MLQRRLYRLKTLWWSLCNSQKQLEFLFFLKVKSYTVRMHSLKFASHTVLTCPGARGQRDTKMDVSFSQTTCSYFDPGNSIWTQSDLFFFSRTCPMCRSDIFQNDEKQVDTEDSTGQNPSRAGVLSRVWTISKSCFTRMGKSFASAWGICRRTKT